MKRYSIIFGLLVIMMGFQNCQKTVSFNGETEETLLGVKDGEEPAEPSVDNASTPPSPAPAPAPTPAPAPVVDGGEECNKPNGKCREEVPENATGNEKGFFCILEGPGNSIKLHLGEQDVLTGELMGVPQAVCMSEAACTDIVSQVFDVKYAKPAGPCRNNPHVIDLTDAELQAKINALKAQPAQAAN